MENMEACLIKINSVIDKKLEKLEELETEKKVIIQKYIKANDNQRADIEQEMISSAEKFKALSDEVSVLIEKIKQLKQIYY